MVIAALSVLHNCVKIELHVKFQIIIRQTCLSTANERWTIQLSLGESGDEGLQIDENNDVLAIDSFNLQNENSNDVRLGKKWVP